MAFKIPPTPVGVPPGHAFWQNWYEVLRTFINEGQTTVQWANINFIASNITDITTREHNALQAFQGGVGGEYYHLTAAEQAWVVAGKASHGGGWQTGKVRPILDEGVTLSTNFASMNFVGAGVTATASGDDITVTVPGGAGTNLGYTAATRILTSDTGTDVTLPLVSSSDAGLAPASGGGTTNFLRADNTWAAPGGGGGGLSQAQILTLVSYRI